MLFVEALGTWEGVGGGIPSPVTMLLEGEEEISSPNLGRFLAANKRLARNRLRADQRHQYVEYRHARHNHAAARDVHPQSHLDQTVLLGERCPSPVTTAG
jgi:hypothetical protein